MGDFTPETCQTLQHFIFEFIDATDLNEKRRLAIGRIDLLYCEMIYSVCNFAMAAAVVMNHTPITCLDVGRCCDVRSEMRAKSDQLLTHPFMKMACSQEEFATFCSKRLRDVGK